MPGKCPQELFPHQCVLREGGGKKREEGGERGLSKGRLGSGGEEAQGATKIPATSETQPLVNSCTPVTSAASAPRSVPACVTSIPTVSVAQGPCFPQ